MPIHWDPVAPRSILFHFIKSSTPNKLKNYVIFALGHGGDFSSLVGCLYAQIKEFSSILFPQYR
jgi:hypothetical protein